MTENDTEMEFADEISDEALDRENPTACLCKNCLTINACAS